MSGLRSDTPAGDLQVRELAPGTRVDRYAIARHLGSGGFGSVHEARHAVLGHPVALKLLHPEHAGSRDMVARFFQEARAATAIGSPHIVKILDCGTSPEGQPFLAMELLEGEPLDVLVRRGPMGVERAVGIALQVLDGLGAAHAAGIVHRDLKPANVFITTEEGADFVKILDFGISKVRTPEGLRDATRSGIVMGTPCYMAPEQFRGARDVDRRADLYSAAVVLYEMLSGKAPHVGRSYEDLVVRVCTEKPRPLTEVAPLVPPLLSGIVDRGLARDPDARWQSAAELARALRSALGVGAPPIAAVRTTPQPAVPALQTRGARTTPQPEDRPSPSVTPRPAIVSPPLGAGRRRPGAPSERSSSGVGRRWPILGAAASAGAVSIAALLMALAWRPGAERAPDPGGAAPTVTVRDGDWTQSAPTYPRAPTFELPAAAAKKPLPPKDRADASVRAAAPNPVRPEVVSPIPPPRTTPTLQTPAPTESAAAGGATDGPSLVPRVVGQLDEERVRQVISGARGRLAGCNPSGRSVRVRVHIHLALGEVRLAVPAPDNQGPADVARCVAGRIGPAFPHDFEPEGSGIVIIDVEM